MTARQAGCTGLRPGRLDVEDAEPKQATRTEPRRGWAKAAMVDGGAGLGGRGDQVAKLRTAFFFKGSKYVMYDIESDTVDASIYPRDISDGWSDFPASFAAGVDAAVNWGNGTAYFFKGPMYLAYDIGGSAVLPGYPLPITEPGK